MRALVNGQTFSMSNLSISATMVMVQLLLASYFFAYVFRYTVRS